MNALFTPTPFFRGVKKAGAVLFGGLLLTTASCQKENDVTLKNPDSTQTIDPSLISYKPSTPRELKLVENLGKITTVLEKLYEDKANVAVVNAAIVSHTYTDESILLKDLVYPERSLLAANPRFQQLVKKFNLNVAGFSSKFLAAAQAANDPEFMRFIESMNAPATDRRGLSTTAGANGTVGTLGAGTSGSQAGDVTIYYPYTPNRVPADGDPDDIVWGDVETLVTATADADAGTGKQWYFQGGRRYYRYVTVDDPFVAVNPTHIIGLNGVEPYTIPTTADAGIAPTGPITLPGATREIKQVYVGDVRCTHQYDKLISFTGNGGGSEIVFTRADGFLKIIDGQVQADVYSSEKKIDRWHISNKKFEEFVLEWDGDWEKSNLNQNLAIYENDNRNDIKLTGSVKTSLTISPGNTIEGNIGFEKTFHSDDAIIVQRNLNYESFFPLNRYDLEGEMYNGWPVRDKETKVNYTLQDRTFKP